MSYDGSGVPDASELAAAVLPALAGLPLTLVLEPGRSLVAAAGALLTRVLYVKEGHGKRFVVVDAGMNDLLRPALYQAFHRVEPVRARGRAPELVDVVGPVCETSDFLARGRELERVEPGELLAVRDAGAYAFSMSSNYNMRPRAAEVMIENGKARLIRRRETFEDLVRTEVTEGPELRPAYLPVSLLADDPPVVARAGQAVEGASRSPRRARRSRPRRRPRASGRPS